MKLKALFTIGIIILTTLNIKAQDSLQTLSAKEVVELVSRYHPVARQAGLQVDMAKADITIVRAGFDPVFSNSMAQKTFDGNLYYQYHRPEVSLPTWFGISLSAGIENLSGNRTDPQETRGKTSYAGISVPLAKNLLMDERRAALRTAKIFLSASQMERRNILNQLLVDAMRQYWQWVQHYQELRVLDTAVQVNIARFRMVHTGYQLGERPAIDTTEALAQLQNFQLQRENAWLAFRNAGIELSVFLWAPGDKPVDLPESVVPDLQAWEQPSMDALVPLDNLLQVARTNHPELVVYDYKLEALGIEKRLAFQELLPLVNFRYQQLGRGYDVLKTATIPAFENNFQYGITMSLPLRLSEGRGQYRKARLKLQETSLQQSLREMEILTRVKTLYNELVTTRQNIQLQQQALASYEALQRGEETRFRLGESSLFLVNARETKTLEALQKLQELRAKYFITINTLQGAAGLLVP